MNAADSFAHSAQNYRVGFLAASLEPVLCRPVGTALAEGEARQLRLAGEFLHDVLAGARLVSKGETGAVSATRAVRALGYALGPLAAIQSLATEDDVVVLLRDMVDCTERSSNAGQLSGPVETLGAMAILFSHLSQAILASLNQRAAIEEEKSSTIALP